MFQTRVVEKGRRHSLCSLTFFFLNRTFYELMWKNIVEPGRPRMTTWLMRIACWIPKATNTHLQYIILFAFPLQQLLHESAFMLRYAYISYLVIMKPAVCPYEMYRTIHSCLLRVSAVNRRTQ